MEKLSPSASSTPRMPSPGHCVLVQTLTPSSSLSKILLVPELVHIAIVGGGASGLAVAIQLISRIKSGHKHISSIMLIEKRTTVGPGLTYSDRSTGLIVNMHSDTMGLCPVNQMQFSDWLQRNTKYTHKLPFPNRQLYGQYLGELAREVLEDAKELGIDFHVINREVIDVHKLADEHGFALTMETGEQVYTKEVILALGNFCATANPELRGNSKYFRCPWPAEKMGAIDRNAGVFVVGSRLTAVDVANALVSNGHAGSITFISRSGKLPKVQGVPARFGERYILYNLARELEGNEKLIGGALDAVISKMKYLILEHDPQAIAHLSGDGEASEVLKEDIRAAESGSIIWQLVIGATAPLLERYWNTFTIEEKQHWLKDFNSTWVTHRHSMPLENGKKILELLESGQLQVVKGSKVLWNESKQRFVLEQEDGNGRSVEGDFLIESLGQEFDTAKINSQLLKTLLSSGLLQSHPVCGIDVDFDTLKTASGIHVIGSLTKGVHFYVTATDRVTAHASRIANSFVKLPPRKPLHIAFFVGSDLFSHLMLSKLVPRLLCLGHLLFIFLPKDSGYAKLKNTNPKPYELEKLQFWERTALQDTIIPLLGTAIQLGAKFLTVQQLASHYGLLFQPIPNINDTSFLQTLKDNHIDIGISLRCYQRFKSPIISYFNSPGRCLLNLHPGKLPEYRGVMTAFRAMSNADLDFGYSLHHIDENFDAGAIIDIKTGTIDYSKAMLEGMNGLYEIGVGMVMDAIERFARGGDLKDGVVEQEVEKARYFTFPTEEEIREGGEKGVEIVGDGALELLVECFGGEDGELKELLREKIGEAWRKWELDMAGNAEV